MTRIKLVGIALVVIVILGLIASGGVWVVKKKLASESVLTDTSILTPTPTVKLSLWDDPAGFTFEYPQDVSIDKHDEDKDNYAHVELTNKDHPGSIIVWAKDTIAQDAGAWVRSEKSFASASVLETTLGDQSAKKVLLASPDKKIVVGAIYDDLLFMIETTSGDGDYWNKIHDTLVDSFSFKPVGDSSASTGNTSGIDELQEAVDEEEVVE